MPHRQSAPPWNWRCASLSHRMMAHGSPSVSPCLGPSRRLHRCRGQMSSVAASLATNLIALRHCVAIRGSENDPLCLLWGPVARLLAPQDEATDHGVVVWSPPHPPCLDVDPRPRQTSRNPAFLGRISPVFWALRCNVQGGWGGSAHYPDPTAQSAPAARPGARRRRHRPGRPLRQPGAGSGGRKPREKEKKFFFFSSC